MLDREWSFRGTRGSGTGVFSCLPGTCANLRPRESVRLGTVLLPEGKVNSVLEELKRRWPGVSEPDRACGMLYEAFGPIGRLKCA